MSGGFRNIAFTQNVRAEQERHGSRAAYARQETGQNGAGTGDRIGPAEAAFIAARQSFYLATVSETGWPYVQHRGGPPGFLKVLDERTIGFADYRGNRQYISVGNLVADDRVSLFLMDYANRRRLKLLGRAEVTTEPDTVGALATPGYRATVERGMLIHVAGFDWNCPQHIPELYSVADVAAATGRLTARIAELEARLAAGGA